MDLETAREHCDEDSLGAESSVKGNSKRDEVEMNGLMRAVFEN